MRKSETKKRKKFELGEFMKLFEWGKDGGPESTVWGFWFIEIKSLFSIVLLRFSKSSRPAYHSHAFDAWTWFLCGEVKELNLEGEDKIYKPSLKPKYTPKSCFHKVIPKKVTYALSIRGPWSSTWKEYDPDSKVYTTFTNGREEISRSYKRTS